VKFLDSKPILRATLFSLMSALLFAASWTAIGSSWPLIFIAFVPLFFLHKEFESAVLTNRQWMMFTVLAFFLWNLSTLYFVSFLNHNWFVRIAAQLTPVGINTVLMSTVFILFSKAKSKFKHKSWPVFIILWLAMEYFQHHWAMAFPWLSLGNVFSSGPQVIQWYEFTGVAGGSLWVLISNVLIFNAIESEIKALRIKLSVAILLVLAIPMLFSYYQFQSFSESGQSIQAVVVQPCLSNSEEKFEDDKQEQNLVAMLNLAFVANDEANLYILPETAIFEPGQLLHRPDTLMFQGLWLHHNKQSFSHEIITDFQETFNFPTVISGVFASEYFPSGSDAPAYADYLQQLDAHVLYYNSAAVFRPDSLEFRHKTMLVPGVETIPFAHVFPFLNSISVDLGGVVGSLGSQQTLESVEVLPNTKAAMLICYDSAFGWLSRKSAQDAGILVVITNDSWWGDTPGYKQLLFFAQLRAIEARKPLLRSANNGVSAVISPRGEILQQLPWDKQGALSAKVIPSNSSTFYVQHGDLIYQLSALLAAAMLLLILANRFIKRAD
jgi:apolipoprotein N-acyltransferase